MKRTRIFPIALLVLAASSALYFTWNGRPTGEVAPALPATVDSGEWVAAPGRVEPLSEEVEVGAEIGGRLAAVLVQEGDTVTEGQVIARIDEAEQTARLASAEALVVQKDAELRRLVNGARGQERREAKAALREAEAVVENARLEAERRRRLYAKGVVSREEADRADRELEVASSRLEAATERHDLIDDDARPEDLDRARAESSLARSRLAEARAALAKTVIRAPISGVVLRRHLQTGETYSTSSSAPTRSIVTLGDLSALRVRADVDETDVARVRLGQRAYARADAYPDTKFWGRVVRISQILGKKNLRTDEPTERVDTKILETLIELEPGTKLPVGLRVDVFVETAPADSKDHR